MTSVPRETTRKFRNEAAHLCVNTSPAALVSGFLEDNKGTFATIFGVSAFALFLSMGLAVDYSQMSRAKSLMNNSLDAAILATGNELLENQPTSTELRTIFENHLYANLGNHAALSDTTEIREFSADTKTGLITATLDASVQMAVMGVLGYDSMPVHSSSQATFSTTPVEISMVLDVTGSMNANGKLASLKLAAADAIDILLPNGKSNSTVRVGLVPYSEGVRLENNLVKKASGQKKYKCMTERVYNPHSDTSYANEYVTADQRANCSSSLVRPLTSANKDLKNDIAALQAPSNAFTAGHLGVAWGYYMLSEKWQNFWPNSSRPANYGGKTKKIAILMTDGEFNTYFTGVNGNPRGSQGNKSDTDAIALCNDMKNDSGIEVYSVAFNAPVNAKVTLQNCASTNTKSTTYYYDANSEAELRTAFREIANSIKELRLTR